MAAPYPGNLPWKGLDSRPKEKPGEIWVYTYPVRIHTKWPNNRCQFGCVSFFFQGADWRWKAVTLKSIVQRDGTCGLTNPNSPSPIGVDVWLHKFTGAGHSVSTDPSVYEDKGHFGKVIEEDGEDMVIIDVDDSFTKDEDFKTKGGWARMLIAVDMS